MIGLWTGILVVARSERSQCTTITSVLKRRDSRWHGATGLTAEVRAIFCCRPWV